MIDTRELRYGCHVLAGGVYETFAAPKHYVKVTQIGSDFIESRSLPGQVNADYYNDNEIEGIPIADIIQILENNGFFKSKLNERKYIKDFPVTHDRVVYDLAGFCTSSGKELVERTGVFYLHQLEACMFDSGIDCDIKLYQ